MPGMCVQETNCSIRGNWQKINQALVEALRQVSLAEMTRPVAHPIRITASSVRNGQVLA